LKILFVGDVMLGRLVNELLKRELPAYPWGDTLSIFKKADLRICNLECVISDRGQPWSITPKVFHFRSDAKNIETLESAGIDAVSLANNHTLDFEYEGMFEMLRILSDAGIYHAGAGADFEEASRPSLFEVSGKKIAFISFTDNEPEWEATPEKPGIFYVPTDLEDDRAKRLFEIIHQTRNEVDFLIVSAHWGPNWGNRPREDQLPFGHRLIVDEMDRNDESFIFLIETSDDKTFRLWLYPTLINDSQARLAGRNEARKIATKMVTLCKELNTVAIWHGKEGVLEISGRGLG
jgi:poly-gamma-glutamate capsule biosynthesis protein CapA/YwtB (metallophosphatase superfamily)